MLKVGEKAPDFTATSTDGQEVSLRNLRGRKVVVYFFHKAFTPGCTVETKGFRDNYEDLQTQGVEVIGISTDAPERQCAFAEKHDVRFPMIADTDKTISKAYGVIWALLPITRRVTYIIDQKQLICAVFHHEFQVSRHLDDVLKFIQKGAAASTV